MKNPENRPDPGKLLEAFVASKRSERAFTALVERFGSLVFSSALRRTSNPQLAEEITQNVFAILARKAESLRRHPALEAWILKTTRLQAASAMRGEQRRQRKIAALTSEANARQSGAPNQMDNSDSWKEAVPILDEALGHLPEKEQKVIVQRFYEGKKFREIAAANRETEGACKKRVKRALENLSRMLGARGVTLSTTVVASALGTELARSAPLQSAAVLAPKALAASSSIPTTTVFANTIQTMSTLKSTSIATAAVFALAAFPLSQQLAEGNRLRSELQTARDQPAYSATSAGRLRTATRNQRGKDQAEPWTPRTASSMLDDLAAPADHRALAKQLLSVSDPRNLEEDPWSFALVYSRLGSMNEEEYDQFLNVMTDFPAAAQDKGFLRLFRKLFHPGLAESWQETLERDMARGKRIYGVDAMAFWSREDPDAAIAWYREKTASGEIFGKGLATPFEKDVFDSLVRTLAESTPKKAFEMLQARPLELRSRGAADMVAGKLEEAMVKSGDDPDLRRMVELLRDEAAATE